MEDTITLKNQEKLLAERTDLATNQNTVLNGLRHSKALADFIDAEILDLQLYYFTPKHVEIVQQGQPVQWTKPYEEFKKQHRSKKQESEEQKAKEANDKKNK